MCKWALADLIIDNRFAEAHSILAKKVRRFLTLHKVTYLGDDLPLFIDTLSKLFQPFDKETGINKKARYIYNYRPRQGKRPIIYRGKVYLVSKARLDTLRDLSRLAGHDFSDFSLLTNKLEKRIRVYKLAKRETNCFWDEVFGDAQT